MNDATYRPVPLEFERFPEAVMVTRGRRFLERLARRRSVRDFAADKVPRELVELAIAAANTAPSGANRQPWHFVAISDPRVKAEIRRGAEAEEREFYEKRAPQEWLDALASLDGADGHLVALLPHTAYSQLDKLAELIKREGALIERNEALAKTVATQPASAASQPTSTTQPPGSMPHSSTPGSAVRCATTPATPPTTWPTWASCSTARDPVNSSRIMMSTTRMAMRKPRKSILCMTSPDRTNHPGSSPCR